MRRLRGVRHIDDLAAQLRRALFQRADVGLGRGFADCNVHRAFPMALRSGALGRQGLWLYFAGSFARSSLNRSAQRMTSSMPVSRDRLSRQPSSVRSLMLSSV